MSTSVDESLFDPVTTPAVELEIAGLNTLMEECILHLPGCSDLMLRKELQHCFRDFCRRTGTLIITDEWDVTYSDPTFPLSKGDGQFLLLHCVKLNGVEQSTGYVLKKECGSVSVEFTLPDGELDEDGDPVVYSAEVSYSYIPPIGSEFAPIWFITKWGDAIVAGTLFRLMAKPGKAWTDIETAKLHGMEYQRQMNGAVIEKLTGGHTKDINSRSSTPFI
jgi:hypothetical protein